jgi:hypothetical protein
MLSRLIEVEDEIHQLVHDKDLKAAVAGMKADARAKFAEMLDTVQSKEFWKKAKALVELSAPAMNLLRLADSDIPATGKVYHEMFKTGKLLESMLASDVYSFIPRSVHNDIHAKWLQRWTDLHSPLHGAGYCLDPEYNKHDHSSCPEALQDLFEMCDRVHGQGTAASAKAQKDWHCAYKARTGILAKESTWTNAADMPPEAWYECYVKPWHPELAQVGMRVLSQVISASSCERNWSAHGHIHSKVRNKLAPETTEKLVFVYSNRKLVTKIQDKDELKMFAWDKLNEDI